MSRYLPPYNSSVALRQLRRLRGAVRRFVLRLWLNYTQVRGPLASAGRQGAWLIAGNDPERLQCAPNLGPNLVGGNILCQQLDRCWPPLASLVGELAARRRAEFWHPPPALDFDLGFAALTPRRLRAPPRGMLPSGGYHDLFIVIYVIDNKLTVADCSDGFDGHETHHAVYKKGVVERTSLRWREREYSFPVLQLRGLPRAVSVFSSPFRPHLL
jgi:hypothetical protein